MKNTRSEQRRINVQQGKPVNDGLEGCKPCKDCIHNDVCFLPDVPPKQENENKYTSCSNHKPKSRYIELPCAVGDTVWVNYDYYGIHTYPVKVYAFRFDNKKKSMRMCVKGDFENTSYGGRYTHSYLATFGLESVGKTVFLTKEEAEQVLKGGAE